MSVERLGTLFNDFRSDERGASLLLVALSLVWIVGLASLVVDVGAGWLSRQTLIPATDAAALAAAQDLVDDSSNEQVACLTARTYVTANAPEAIMASCDVTTFANGGRVTVAASDDLETTFTDLNSDGIAIQSISTATWGPPLTVSALRPFALCYDGSSDLQQLIDNPPNLATSVTVDFLKDDPAACGGASSLGNFATVDFEGGTGTQEIRNWMRDGFPGQLSFDPTTIVDCLTPAVCHDRPYASGAIMPELLSLRSSGDRISMPIFNYADATEIHLIGMLRASIDDFHLDGPSSGWWMDLVVEPGLVTGTCCGPPALHGGNQVIAICGVDAEVYEACEPSG